MSALNKPPLYAPLRLSPRRSRCLLLYRFTLHLLALAAISTTRLSTVWVAVMATLVCLSMARVLSHWLRSPSGLGVVSAVWQADERWQLDLLNGREFRLRGWDAPVVHPRLVVLRFWQDRLRCRCLWLCPDSLDAEQLRRLRVRLRRHSMKRPVGQSAP